MKTFMAKPESVERKWYIIDAAGLPLGRVASQAAAILRGKNKATFTPHVDTGDHVIIVNCGQALLTGKKLDKKFYRYHTGHIGGLKEIQYKKLMEEKPEFAMQIAVKGMLPKNSLGRAMFKKLRTYSGAEHKHEAQKPEVITLSK